MNTRQDPRRTRASQQLRQPRPDLIGRLTGVRETGAGRWVARCPSHPDRHPSLSIRETSDGRWLLHCFAGCPVADVLDAIDLEFGDLWPPEQQQGRHRPRERRPFAALDALRCIASEARVVAVAAADIGAGRPLSKADIDRVLLAAQRLDNAATTAEGA